MDNKIIKGYKAYDKGMTCKGFQYKEGETYECSEAKICSSGFHFCENPLDVLDYYNLCESEFSEVESIGKAEKHNEDSKVCTTKIKIGARLSLSSFIKASVDFLMTKTTNNKETASSGDYSKLASSGNYSQLEINGSDSVGVAIGIDNQIKGTVGSWITLAEWKHDHKKQRYVPICVKSVKIDGKKIKADTFYKLQKGKFVKA